MSETHDLAWYAAFLRGGSTPYYKFGPSEPSLCWDVKVGWVPVREIDPATGRCYVQGPGESPLQPQE